jgi:hypothetical protein
LREYNPCLRCGDLTTSDNTPKQVVPVQIENVDEFDQVDDEGDGRGEPPAYDDEDFGGEGLSGGEAQGRSTARGKQEGLGQQEGRGMNDGEEEEVEVVEVRHTVLRNDTILSIARKYGADVSCDFIRP